MSKPKYSVIIPVYNRPQEIEELLEEHYAQTGEFHALEVMA